ncbi:MAG: hypothetical protein AAF366_19010 [Pseudomonadota bacterium]
MAGNVTNELLLETLKAMQAKLSDVASDIHDVKTDLRGIKGHMASFMQSELAQDNSLASIQARIERIERRLDLSES